MLCQLPERIFFVKVVDHQVDGFFNRKILSLRTGARVFMELDQLYKKIGVPPEERLKNLEKYPELVEKRDDLYTEYITLLNTAGKIDKALKLMLNRRFHPWEGGEGKITKQYIYFCVEKLKRLIGEKESSWGWDIWSLAGRRKPPPSSAKHCGWIRTTRALSCIRS